jgi:hypothetical protein
LRLLKRFPKLKNMPRIKRERKIFAMWPTTMVTNILVSRKLRELSRKHSSSKIKNTKLWSDLKNPFTRLLISKRRDTR